MASFNMYEKTFEDIICKYPELIEDGLTFKGRQLSPVKEKRIDVVFIDKYKQLLIVEIKKGAVKREHVGQLFDYVGLYLSTDNPNVRAMLIGNRVPENIRRSLDHYGIEWRELTIDFLINFLKQKGDFDLLNIISSDQSLIYINKANHRSGDNMKQLTITQENSLLSNSNSMEINSPRIDVEHAIVRIREDYLNDLSFHSVRHQAEAKAKAILNSSIGKMSGEEIRNFLEYVNTESIKGKKGLTRFQRHFTTILSPQIYGCTQEFNEWIGALWRAEEKDIKEVLQKFLMISPIKGAGTLLPTFILYLRNPSVFNIWTKTLEGFLCQAYAIKMPNQKTNYERYTLFNHKLFKLLIVPFSLKSEEVDLVLSQLPKYMG
jgi:hypothetical protein